MSLFSDFTDSIGRALGDILGSGGFVDDLGRSIARPLNRAGRGVQQFVTDPANTFSDVTGIRKSRFQVRSDIASTENLLNVSRNRFKINKSSLNARHLFKDPAQRIRIDDKGFFKDRLSPPSPPEIPKPPKRPPPLNFKRPQGGFILPNTNILAGQAFGARVGTGQLRIRRQ